jgi:hypothetical protein
MATFPTLHLNGTGKITLRDGYANAYDAIDKAIEALANAELNGRQAHQYAGEMLAGICDQM